MTEAERLVRDYLDAGDRGDVDELARLLDPDVVTRSPGGVTTHGSGALIESWRIAHEGLGGLRHDVVDVLADGSTAVARVRVRGAHTGRFLGIEPTGARIEVD